MMFLFREFLLRKRKEIRVAVKYIYGIGWHKANAISAKVGFGYPYFLDNSNLYYFNILTYLLKGFVVGRTRIKHKIQSFISKMIENGSYVGLCHKMYLPVHGQRTRSNARTQRSKRLLMKVEVTFKKKTKSKRKKEKKKLKKLKKNKNF